jgi:hypothetical protein
VSLWLDLGALSLYDETLASYHVFHFRGAGHSLGMHTRLRGRLVRILNRLGPILLLLLRSRVARGIQFRSSVFFLLEGLVDFLISRGFSLQSEIFWLGWTPQTLLTTSVQSRGWFDDLDPRVEHLERVACVVLILFTKIQISCLLSPRISRSLSFRCVLVPCLISIGLPVKCSLAFLGECWFILRQDPNLLEILYWLRVEILDLGWRLRSPLIRGKMVDVDDNAFATY